VFGFEWMVKAGGSFSWLPSQVMGPTDYVPAEGQARREIDAMLEAAGWKVQDRDALNLWDGPGQAIREFTLKEGHGRVDYLLFVGQMPVGTIEAKSAGTTLTEVELQSLKYVTGLPDDMVSAIQDRLPFAYESTGKETRFTNGLDPDPRSRRIYTFHRPETLQEWADIALAEDDATPVARLQHMPPLITDNLWRSPCGRAGDDPSSRWRPARARPSPPPTSPTA